MAPSQKRKPAEDEFIHTISDNEDVPFEEEEALAQPPKKKTKTGRKPKTPKKEDILEVIDEPEGIWGQKEDDDEAMDSDFEFGAGDAGDFGAEDLEGWDIDTTAKRGMKAAKAGVDLDEIIRRRYEQKHGKTPDTDAEKGEGQNDADVDLDDDEDGVLADDAFGMNVGSDVEESGGEEQEPGEDNDDDAASDNDSVATPVGHPDDDGPGGSDYEEDPEEDPEEEARRRDFFAPEEKEKPGKNTYLSSFQAMSLSRPILRGLATVGFTKPTPIQAKSIPIALMGKDLVGGAVTGSGKTGAFIVPILERLLYRPKKVPTTRVVVLTPTRELAMQCHSVGSKLAAHTDIKFTLAVGGLSLKAQEIELRLRPDVIIATPGRFIDHMRNSASFNVDTVEILVLDEADRMLEDGFADELNEILTTLPKSRQTMLFSATMTSTVDRLIRLGMNKPVRVMVDSQKKTVTTLVQEFVRLRPGREEKRMGYLAYICKTFYSDRVIVFFRQKKDAHRARIIFGLLGMSCAELHGSMNQTMRIASVENFRDGKVSYLLATDLASRGLDIKGVDTVINYEAPQSVEIYVHRVGRTARAGRKGVALTLAAETDRKVVKAAVRMGKAQGAKVISRIIDAVEADKLQAHIDNMDDEVEDIMKEEKEEKVLAQAEMHIKKGENLIEHEAEIKARPKRTWFETEHDKKKAKTAGKEELNGIREAMKKKGGKLSNKDKKLLDNKALRASGQEWRKGKSSESDLKEKAKAKSKAKTEKKMKVPKPPAARDDFPWLATEHYEQRLFHPLAKVLSCARVSVVNNSIGPVPPRQKTLSPARPRGRPTLQQPRSHTPSCDKLAPFNFFGLGRSHPRHKQSLFRLLFPRTVRDQYRERLLGFHLETLPYLKHNFQSRVYRYILERQRRRAEKSRIVDIVARQGRRLLLGPQRSRPLNYVKDRQRGLVARKMSAPGASSAGYGSDRERGFRRKRLAAMAGSLYRTGQQAVTEIRESYTQTRARGMDGDHNNHGRIHIPGAFPDVAITVQGGDQMVLFPSYAKRHTRREWGEEPAYPTEEAQGALKDEDYWRQEWERNEDERAIVDVDVRGWIYSPHVGPMTRRNRFLIGLARQLSGIPAPRFDQAQISSTGTPQTHHQMHEEIREQEKVASEAARIERQGQEEKRVAYKGGYSEKPRDGLDPDTESIYPPKTRSGNQSPDSAPTSPSMPARSFSASTTDLSEAELTLANANLMARISPFMTNPMVALPITLFFYNDSKSQSRTVITNDAGHFVIRAALDFIPTHVRVLANENLSATQEVKVIEPTGISLISDIDDTIKRSNISGGAKEIFRNTFVRDLHDLTVEGVTEWYNRMYELGVSIHYCSNSPWQLFPVLASYFKLTGLPPGSLHLKQYSGMLQGIFEPVAERKKSTLNRLLRDFPQRKFLLIGDSGEADLEVYTELALANPGRILAVFIRDVTTPEQTGFFNSGFAPARKTSSLNLNDGVKPSSREKSSRQNSTPSIKSDRKIPAGPAMGKLIDLSDEPEETQLDRSAALAQIRNTNANRSVSTSELLTTKKPPPPRPSKPAALRSARSISDINKGVAGRSLSRESSTANDQPPPTPARKPAGQLERPPPHPLSQMSNLSQQASVSSNSIPRSITPQQRGNSSSSGDRPPPPPPRRRGTPSNAANKSPRPPLPRRTTASNTDVDYEPLPPPKNAPPAFSSSRSGTRSDGNTPTSSPTLGPQAVNKKLELWRRRLARAHEQLDGLGVALYTWRKGNDVISEAEGLVKEALKDMEKRGMDNDALEREFRKDLRK
ncbi:hypothetical protein G7046_g2278 [Stylonectria norvegica]|nr:hypothetical protein G7046_g2278 [Stylonectria norvegica]